MVLASALIGAAAAGTVARATGWGRQTVEIRYVTVGKGVTEQPTDIPSIVTRLLPEIVEITAKIRESSPLGGSASATSTGTGVVVTAGGEIVTNDHVVADATSITVQPSESSATYAARLVGASSGRDLALLQVTAAKGLRPATFATSSTVAVGDDVVAIGYALALAGKPTVTAGIISGEDRKVTARSDTGTTETLTGMLQTDAPVSSGNSGGPLVNGQGRVVGINTLASASTQSTTAQDIGFAIPAAEIQAVLPGLRQADASRVSSAGPPPVPVGDTGGPAPQ